MFFYVTKSGSQPQSYPTFQPHTPSECEHVFFSLAGKATFEKVASVATGKMFKRITFTAALHSELVSGEYERYQKQQREKGIVMRDVKKEIRNKWLHIRLNETEYRTISNYYQKTTCKELSDYARRVLLKKPVTINHRNQSADEILAEMIRLKNELNAIGNNFNQAVHKLHTLNTTADIKLWVLMSESQRVTLLKKTEEIKVRMNEIYEQWLQK